jgi:hypothetical protein
MLHQPHIPERSALMPSSLTDEDLLAMEQRLAATQAAPWTSYVEGRDHTCGSDFIQTGEGAARGEDIELSGATVADQDFIAAARQDMPRLLAEVRALRKRLASSRQQ